MKKQHMIAIALLVCLMLAGVVFATSYEDSDNKTLSNVSIRLKWLDQAQFAGYYWAKEEGLYRNKGLNVSLFPGGPDISPMQMVVNGTNDFGIIGADQLLLAREKGLPVVAVAVIYQDTAVSFASLKKSGITAPADLAGKKVAIAYGRDEEVVYEAMLKNAGVNRSTIEESPLRAN